MERENLPSFSECFQGFHKMSQLGESHIVAASPQQYQGTPQQQPYSATRGTPHVIMGQHHTPPSALLSPPHQVMGSVNVEGMTSMNLSPVRMTPKGQHTTNPIRSGSGGVSSDTKRLGAVAGSSYQHQSPNGNTIVSPTHQMGLLSSKKSPHGVSPTSRMHVSGDMPLPAAKGTQSANGVADFSFRAMEDSILTDEESASDPVATPPREIERDDAELGFGGSSSEAASGGAFGSPTFHRTGGSGSGGDGTPLHQRPPLHPNLSPILSPFHAAAEGHQHHQMVDPPIGVRRSWDEDSSTQGARGLPSGEKMSYPDIPRRARTLEEIAVKHLFPLFGEFLRSLPPKHLEALLLACDPQNQGPLFDDDGFRDTYLITKGLLYCVPSYVAFALCCSLKQKKDRHWLRQKNRT